MLHCSLDIMLISVLFYVPLQTSVNMGSQSECSLVFDESNNGTLYQHWSEVPIPEVMIDSFRWSLRSTLPTLMMGGLGNA